MKRNGIHTKTAHDKIRQNNTQMNENKKPTWITEEQWAANPTIYHWEQSQVAMESLKQLQSQPTSTREQVIYIDPIYGTNTGQTTKVKTLTIYL